MNEKYLLDCTLRDGGYLNDWDYGTDLMHSIFSGLVKAGVDFIEVGFLDDRRPVDYNRSINPTTACYDHIYQGMGKGHSTVLAMIDFGTCDIKNLSPKKDSFLDGIRVIFKKEKKEKAMAYVAEVKKLGYKVFAQMVSITAYEEKDLAEFVALANSVKPFGVSIVDTYGLLDGNELSKYADYLNAHLDPSIVLGFHAHNNRQLGFSNDLTFLQKNFARPQLVDGTLFGMGKSAGNSQTEQVVTELNNQYGKSYNKGAILDLIEQDILPLQATMKWGYQLDFFLCSSHRVHPNYVKYLRKKGLDAAQIDVLLAKLEGDKKLLYDENYIAQIYEQSQKA